MLKVDRLGGCSDGIDLSFLERERTPRELMELDIRLHLAELSVSNTVWKPEKFDVERSPKAVHDWVQKADLRPTSDVSPDHVALDETVIRIDDQQFWLYAAVDPEPNIFPHIQLFTTTTTALTQQFLREIREKHDVSDAMFLVDYAKHLATELARAGIRFQPVRHGIGMVSEVSFTR